MGVMQAAGKWGKRQKGLSNEALWWLVVKILFVLHLYSHSRHFHQLIERLVARGDDVELIGLHKLGDWRPRSRIPPHLKAVRPLTLLAPPEPRNDRFGRLTRRLRGARNYTIYAHPNLRNAQVFKTRAAAFSPRLLRRAFAPDGPLPASWLAKAASAFERLAPPDPAVVEALRARAPDVVLVSPLIFNEMLELNEYVKAAQHLAIPVGFPVFSWDNLTTKGTAHTLPDRIFVWNETQKWEATAIHGWPRDRIEVLGAWRFDGFADQAPRHDYNAFCGAFGFDPARRTVCYLGSSPIVAPHEGRFVTEWISALRSSSDLELARANVLVRPHPRNLQTWQETAGLGDVERVAMQPVDAQSLFDTDDLFEGLHHSRAVVGLITSAMIEAALLGKPVHTVLTSAAGEGQGGTAHFDYLTSVGGGLLHQAKDLDEHMRLLSDSLAAPGPDARAAAFVNAFVRRPGGGSAVDGLLDAVDRLARREA